MPIATMQIKDVLKRDLDEKIEEIIKLEQGDQQVVFHELTEYVVTDRIRDHYRTLLKAMADAPSEPDERVGIWISGFFGSGKSSFAKILGYVLANREVLGKRATELFLHQVDDPQIERYLDFINSTIPTEVIMFDVSVSRAVRRTNERIAEIMYTVLLKHLDYAEDYDIAELEIELEADGKLREFERVCQERFDQPWRRLRAGANRMIVASNVLYQMDPRTYPQADSWARSLAGKTADITVAKLVDRAFELMDRRRPGKALAFIIDEVGQYVARSADKIEDLRAVVERFGQESRNRVKRGQAKAPVWIAVTSQEKLEEVVAAIDSKRVELAKVQDRFYYRVDLAPADIREVATKRVLGKRPQAEPELRKLYTGAQGQLNTACQLRHTSRKSEVGEADFVQFYPYLPHYIELSIDIVSGIRVSQPGAPQHLGGSNRTIIKQAHEMLVSPRTHLASEHVGRLVTLDLIYDLVEGNLSSEKRMDISEIGERFRDDPHDRGWSERVAKVICLLELVRDLPRTEENVAAVLVDMVGKPAPLPEVKAALERLVRHQFVRRTEEGYKLQTAQEKRWDTERKAFDPKPREQNDIKRETLVGIFSEPALRAYRYKNQRTFRVDLSMDSMHLEDGQIPLALLVADSTDPRDDENLAAKADRALIDSRVEAHQNDIFWVFALTPEVHTLIHQLYSSRQMIAKYSQVGAQGQLMGEYAPLLEGEKREESRLRQRLRDKMEEAIAEGRSYFRGVSKDASALGQSLPQIFHTLFESAMPALYPQLDLGIRSLKGNEAEELLKAANLNGLPPVFYAGEQGLGLVITEGGKAVYNTGAPIAKEVLDYLKREHSYGNRVTGRELEAKFTGLGYGWDPEVIKLVLALLLRAGTIEVTYQGRRYRNAQDPQSRVPFTNVAAFRAASYTPRESIDLRTLTAAVRSYEALTGEEVDVEEGAIAEALKKLANDEIQTLLPVRAEMRANQLPGLNLLDDYYTALTTIQNAASDDCVRTLAGEGNTLKEARSRAQRIERAVTADNLAIMRESTAVLKDQWPILKDRGAASETLASDAEQLEQELKDASWYEQLTDIRRRAQAIAAEYAARYQQRHVERFDQFSQAIDQLKGSGAWLALVGTRPGKQSDESEQEYQARLAEYSSREQQLRADVLTELNKRQCTERDAELFGGATTCGHCEATLSQMDSDLAALPQLKANALATLYELTAPPVEADGDGRPRVQRVHAADYFADPLDSEGAVKLAIQRLEDELIKLVSQGARIVVE